MRILKEIRTALDSYQIKSGIYHFYRGEYPQAIQFLGRALLSRDRISEADAGIARYYLTQAHICAAEEAGEAGDNDGAIGQLRAAAEVNPDYPDIHFRLARAFEDARRLPDAIEHLRRACELNPRYLEARCALAFALMSAGQAEEASEEFQELFKLTVAGIARPYREGLRHLAARKTEAAARLFQRAFFSEPYRFTSHYRGALAHLRKERWQDAVDDLRAAIHLQPDFPDLHNYIGVALAESGHLGRAIASFRESVRLNSRYGAAWLNLAYALAAAGETDEAEEILVRLLSTEPDCSAARARLEEIRSTRVDPRRLEARRGSPGRGR